MKGVKHIMVSNRDVKFEFDLYRNITIVRGDSGTGKTTLYSLIVEHMRDGEKSGVNVSSPCPCVAIEDKFWQLELSNTKESIVFIDEGASYLSSKEFAGAVKNSDNYFVIFTREDLHSLPYSIDEIYEIKTSGKFHKFKKLYDSQLQTRCFGTKNNSYDLLITEDSKSGYQFFSNVCSDIVENCLPAGSNSTIYGIIGSQKNIKALIIADGAAFGSEIDRLLKIMKCNEKSTLYLPESFEWLILKSGLIDNVAEKIDNPSEYVESKDYFSWEQYFTELLRKSTSGTYLEYQKEKLNKNYLNEKEKKAIVDNIPFKI